MIDEEITMEFRDAVEIVLKHEGGYVNDPNDPGGETKYGISKRAYPDVDIENLTLEQAKQIYLNDYWNRCQCDNLPAMVRLHVFDAAVNSGVSQAAKWLQRAVRVVEDGKIGAHTIMACRLSDPAVTAMRICAYRLHFLSELNGWKRYSKGWTARITGNMMR